MSERILIYGATGYTGKRMATEAARLGLDVVLAGRDPDKLKGVAGPLGLESRVFSLENPRRLREALGDARCVLHIAGPFSKTSTPMVDACLETGTHYLDVTGEIDVFEAIARRGPEAEARGVLLMPGVGFDVVPSDCLAAYVAAKVDDPIRLRIAIAGMGGGVSRGTAKTMVESLGDGLRIRRDGILQSLPSGSLVRDFDFGAGPTKGVGMPWGDVSTAFHSTGVPNIEVYFILGGTTPRLMRASSYFAPILRAPVVQRFLKNRVDSLPEGPSDRDVESSRTELLAEVEGRDGQTARALLTTPNGYRLTVDAALEIAQRVVRGDRDLRGESLVGYHTPSSAFGADFVLALPGCAREDL